MPSSSSWVSSIKQADMSLHEESINFVCRNYATDYIAGVLVLPKEFGVDNSEQVPKRLLIHVPPGIVWNGIYSKERNWIEGLEKMMIFYSIKPYHLISLKYIGGPSFNLQIFNPYGVEIDYSISKKAENVSAIDRSFFDFSDIEVDKLCATMTFNAYNSGHGVYDLVIQKKHLLKKDYYKILKRKACSKLGLVDSTEWVKLSFKNLTWVIKLKWKNGKVYMGRKWYDFAKAGNLREGDTCVFQMTGRPQKFIICVFESDIRLKCNTKGVGHASGVMTWFKVVNEVFLYVGQMEIPRAFIELGGAKLTEKVNLIMRDGNSIAVDFSSRRNYLYGLKKMLTKYSIELNDVMVFTYVSESTFAVSVFNSSGMEVNYTFEEEELHIEQNNAGIEHIIVLSDSSSEEAVGALALDNGEVPVENMIIEVPADEDNSPSFHITLKPSHVDKRGHGLYCPTVLYSYYKDWTKSTTVRLICGRNISHVSVLRKKRMCRFGKGWTEFTVANNLVEGQVLQLVYVADKTFEVHVVG